MVTLHCGVRRYVSFKALRVGRNQNHCFEKGTHGGSWSIGGKRGLLSNHPWLCPQSRFCVGSWPWVTLKKEPEEGELSPEPRRARYVATINTDMWHPYSFGGHPLSIKSRSISEEKQLMEGRFGG
jgi:hypothetical protein